MFSHPSNTILHSFLLNEAHDILDTYTVGDTATTTTSVMKRVRGDILAPISPDVESVTSLISNHNVRFTTTYSNFYNADNFLDNLKSQVIIPKDSMSYTDAVQYITNFISKAGSNFYGALLKQGNTFMNPFHPITALSALELNPEGKYQIYMYFYPDRSDLDDYYYTKHADLDAIHQNIAALMRAFNSGGSSTATCTVKQIGPDYSYSAQVEFRKTVKFTSFQELNRITADKEYYLSTQQLLTRGIFIPYYGSSIIRKTSHGHGEGLPLSPFLAVNIGRPAPAEVNGQAQSSFSSICTGSRPRHTLDGIRTLTHANLSSPMNRDSLLPGCLAYADACINMSLNLYHRAGVITDCPSLSTDYSLSIDIPDNIIEAFITHGDNFTDFMVSQGSTPIDALNYYKQFQTLQDKGLLDDYLENNTTADSAED